MANPARVEVQRSLYGSIGVLTGRRAIRQPVPLRGQLPDAKRGDPRGSRQRGPRLQARY